jgi:AraC-like DNA-binding protein
MPSSEFDLMKRTIVATRGLNYGNARLPAVSNVRFRRERISRRLLDIMTDAEGNVQLSLKQCSDSLRVSRGHLGALFKSLVGHSFRTQLRLIRTDTAKRLLVHDDLSIKEIAARLGYSEPSNFVRDFHACVGVTPTTFRSNHLSSQIDQSHEAAPAGRTGQIAKE